MGAYIVMGVYVGIHDHGDIWGDMWSQEHMGVCIVMVAYRDGWLVIGIFWSIQGIHGQGLIEDYGPHRGVHGYRAIQST